MHGHVNLCKSSPVGILDKTSVVLHKKTLLSETHCILNELGVENSISRKQLKMVPSHRHTREKVFRETGVFSPSFCFTLVSAEKAVSSCDGVVLGAGRENGWMYIFTSAC